MNMSKEYFTANFPVYHKRQKQKRERELLELIKHNRKVESDFTGFKVESVRRSKRYCGKRQFNI